MFKGMVVKVTFIELYLCDFGLLLNSSSTFRTDIGTSRYRSPRQIQYKLRDGFDLRRGKSLRVLRMLALSLGVFGLVT